MFYKVLVADDEVVSLESTRSLLESRGFRVETALSGEEALEKLKASPSQYALVILDYRMSGMNGAATSRALLSLNPNIYVLIHSWDESSDVVKSSWEAGAHRFIEKSEDPDIFVSKVRSWYKKFEEEHPSDEGRATPAEVALISLLGMVGRSKALASIARQINRYSPLRESVLILGETGSGKEKIARALHGTDESNFFAVNCAAFRGDTSLLESELFGHVRGAFTGAEKDKKGILEQAQGGTVFLDEIQALSLIAQEKLLRAIQSKTMRPVGANREFKVDFRLLAAGKPNLKEMAEGNLFLPDLYERLNVLIIKASPLRERPEDIEPLIQHFCTEYEKTRGVRKIFHSRAIRYMEKYPWPRNVRQLENAVRRLCINTETAEEITLRDVEGKLDDDSTSSLASLTGQSSPLRTKISEMERTNLISILRKAGSIREAARTANLPETTFRRRMDKHGIPFSGWQSMAE